MTTDDRVNFEDAWDGSETPATISCEQIQSVLLAWMARELGANTSALVREHLRHCATCQAEMQEVAATLELLRDGDPAYNAPPTLAEYRRQRIIWAWAHPFLDWCVLWHRWISLIAAILALLLAFHLLRGWSVFAPPPPDGIPVTIGTDNHE